MPQVVLLDLRLPGMDGLEFVRELRAQAPTRNLLIVAMTASAMRGDEEIALAAGCDGYLTKPINIRTLADSIEGFVKGRPGRPVRT